MQKFVQAKVSTCKVSTNKVFVANSLPFSGYYKGATKCTTGTLYMHLIMQMDNLKHKHNMPSMVLYNGL